MREIEKLAEQLREYAEWAKANECEVPICLSDDLLKAADVIERLQTEDEALKRRNTDGLRG